MAMMVIALVFVLMTPKESVLAAGGKVTSGKQTSKDINICAADKNSMKNTSGKSSMKNTSVKGSNPDDYQSIKLASNKLASNHVVVSAAGEEMSLAQIMTEKHTAALIGHRGFSSLYPENTLSAFLGAYQNGFKGIEMDVLETRSGDLLVFHDIDMERLCGVDEDIRNVTGQSRYNYKVKGSHDILTLDEALGAVRNYKGPIFIHIKEYNEYGYLPSRAGVKKIAGIIKKYNLQKRAVVMGARTNISRFSGKYGIRYGLLTRKCSLANVKKLSAWAKKHKVSCFIFVRMNAMNHDARKKVKILHDKNMKVGIYFTYTKKDMKKLDRAGVDYALSDFKLR